MIAIQTGGIWWKPPWRPYWTNCQPTRLLTDEEIQRYGIPFDPEQERLGQIARLQEDIDRDQEWIEYIESQIAAGGPPEYWNKLLERERANKLKAALAAGGE